MRKLLYYIDKFLEMKGPLDGLDIGIKRGRYKKLPKMPDGVPPTGLVSISSKGWVIDLEESNDGQETKR